MNLVPRETLVQYQQAIESILSESKAEGKNKLSNYDSRLAIDCKMTIIKNYLDPCSPPSNGMARANITKDKSVPTLPPEKMSTACKKCLTKN